MSKLETLTSTGGLLLWPLLVLALSGLILFIERFLYLHRGHINKNKFLAGVKALVGKDRLVEALTLCEESPGPITSVVRAALLHFDEGQESIRRGIQGAALTEVPLLERRVGGIVLVANLAPFLGLIGTGVAALNAFQRLHETGPYVNSALFAGDVGQALVSTVAGLAIAALAIVGHHFIIDSGHMGAYQVIQTNMRFSLCRYDANLPAINCNAIILTTWFR